MECKTDSRKVAGFFVMLGLIAVAIAFYSAITKYRSFERVVSVKGLCEKEVKADKVIWPIVYKSVGNNIAVLYDEINHNNAVILKMLKDNGIEDEEISVNAPVVVDGLAELYTPENMKNRYNVTSVITVSTSKVDQVRQIIADQAHLLKQGIAIMTDDYRYRTEYLYTGLNELKPLMIEEATHNAREVAEKFAKDSKSKLGKIKNASQGQFSIYDRDANTPYIKNVRVVSSLVYYLKD